MASGARPVIGDGVGDGVGRIPGFVNSYTYQTDDEIYLIDTGFSRTPTKILQAFRRSNVPIERVRKVLLTHHHVDHMGGAAFIQENLAAPLACHAEDIPFVEGRTKVQMPLLMRLFVRIHPARVAFPLQDHDHVGPLEVLHAPGHTPGELAFYEPARKILFTGDSVVERKGALTLPGKKYAANLDQAVRSLDRLRTLEIETLLPGHGVPVRKNVAGLLDDLIRRAPAEFLHRPAR
jgi:glyoxylase-like metal-dependent hydrolase (beta-lactamase superfamily II)